MRKPKPPRGGTRPGAGRPPSGRVPYSVSLHPAVVAALDRVRSTSRSAAIEAAIKAWLMALRRRD